MNNKKGCPLYYILLMLNYIYAALGLSFSPHVCTYVHEIQSTHAMMSDPGHAECFFSERYSGKYYNTNLMLLHF